MANIDIFGTLNNATPDATLAKAAQIKDDALGKKQSEINADYKRRIESLEENGGGGGSSALFSGNTLSFTSGATFNNNILII